MPEERKPYKFSQSGLKDLESEENCPVRWQAVHIHKTERYELGIAADYGKFFEHLCLGTDTGVSDLDKLKSGKPSAIELRIRAQANLFKAMHDPNSNDYIGLEVVLANISLSTKEKKGILDYCATDSEDHLIWCDLKMVADLDRGYYQYGDHENADYTQQIFYKDLLLEKMLPVDGMWVVVFEHGLKRRVKIIKLKISERIAKLTNERVHQAEEVVKLYDERGWVKMPSVVECKKCSLKCQERIQEEKEEEQQLPLMEESRSQIEEESLTL